jgi:hypothetical protein
MHLSRFFYATKTKSYLKFHRKKEEIEEIFKQRIEPGFQHCFTYIPTPEELAVQGVYYYRIHL